MPSLPPTSPPITTTLEAGGYVLTCACQWVKWAASVNDAAEARRLHAKSCKTCQAVGE